MRLDAKVEAKVSRRMRDEILDLVGEGGVAPFVREAVSEKLRRPGSQGHEYREVVFEPRGDHTSFDAILEVIAARQPLLSDLTSREGTLHPALRRMLRKKLTDAQARRIEKVLSGMKLAEIGHDEECSKQAVGASTQRAYETMRADAEVIAVFIEVYGRTGEMDAHVLVAAYNKLVDASQEKAHAAK